VFKQVSEIITTFDYRSVQNSKSSFAPLKNKRSFTAKSSILNFEIKIFSQKANFISWNESKSVLSASSFK